MDRNVLLLYLRDLRDLELAKHAFEVEMLRYEDQYNAVKRRFEKEVAEESEPHYWRLPEKDLKYQFEDWLTFAPFMVIIGAIILVLSLFAALSAGKVEGFLPLFIISAIFMLIGGVPWVMAKDEEESYDKEVRKVEEHNRLERERVEKERPKKLQAMEYKLNVVQNEISEKSKKLRVGYQKCLTLLEQAYSLNIIPSRYRDRKSMYFIYEFMSTSQVSLEDALLHGLIDDGFARIEARLATIVSQNEQILLQNRRRDAQNREMIEQNNELIRTNARMLESQERTEKTAREAAQSAQIAAENANTCAFFATMNYLEK